MALSILYPPRNAAVVPSLDIVAVHGLGGNATSSWTHPQSRANWLKDFLPQKVPDARIMTFGYNADAAFGRSTSEIVDHAKSLLASLIDKRDEPEEVRRPLIFIAHSLGGIVVKQALLQSHLESRYRAIKDATLGLIFLGTPHRGSDKATYGRVLANVAQFISNRPPPRLLTALETNSDALLRLTTDFRFQLPNYEVYSFFEQRPMNGLSTLVVEKHSALLDIDQEEQIPVDADHIAMCKFETDDNDTFEKIYKRVRRLKNKSTAVTPRMRPVAEIVSQKYEELNEAKADRDELRERLYTEAIHLETVPLSRPRLVCIDFSCKEIEDDGTGSGKLVSMHKTICASPYYLENIPVETLAHPEMLKLPPFDGKEECKICGHSWMVHFSQIHELRPVRKRVIDKMVEAALTKLTTKIDHIESIINSLET